MRSKTPFRRRIISMMLSLVCVFGLFPTAAMAAEAGIPDQIVLADSEYPTGTGKNGLATYTSPGLNSSCALHLFKMTVNGKQVVGFCGDHSKYLGASVEGHPWNNPSRFTTNAEPLLAYYYWSKENDTKWNGQDDQSVNGFVQASVWLGIAGKLPDWKTNREQFIEVVAKERDAVFAQYGWPIQPTWTSKQHINYILNNYSSGKYGTNWSFYEYQYAGKSTKHPQPIIVGFNQPTVVAGSLRFRKIDTAGNNIANVEFKVESADGSFTTNVKTNSSGIAAFQASTGNGWYYITETKVPDGYAMDTTRKRVYLDENATPVPSVELVNTKTTTGSLSIRKVDKDEPTKGLPGATIKITQIGGGNNYTTTWQTGADGYCIIKQEEIDKIPVGTYRAEETVPPQGYTLNSKPQEFQWDGKTPVSLVFENDSKVELKLLKTDASGKPLAGATFEVTKDGQPVTVQTTGADGTIVINGITEGFYVFTETSAPKGYALPDVPYVGVEVDQADIQGRDTIEVTMKNYQAPTLTISKTDLETGDPIPGTKFSVAGINNTFYTEVTTGPDGKATLDNLEKGAYEVTEMSVPSPYILDTNNHQTVSLAGGDNRTLIFQNSKLPGLRIIKKDATTNGRVAGVTFLIEKLDGSYSETATTDKNGEIFLEKLGTGSYKVTETHVPGNYILNDEPQTVTLEANKTSTLEFFNYQRPGLLIQKVDTSGSPIKGVKFNVKVKDGSDIGTFTTNDTGEIFIPDLSAGWYTVTETFVPDGYILDPTPHDVLLEKGASGDGKASYTLRLENLKTPELTIYKVDSVVGGPVEGAKFQIWFAGNGEAAGTLENLGIFFSDKDGKIELGKSADGVGRLKEGWYKVKEIEAPDGYQIKEPAEQSIYLKGDDVKELTFKNTPLSALIVLKKDSVNGKPVQGATFQLRYLGGTSGTEGTVIGQKTTSVNGTAVWTRLKAGTYIVEEVSAPDGYNIVTAMQTVYISGKDQDVITVEFDNQPDGNLLIKKVCSVNPSVTLANAQFKVTYADGTLVGNDNGMFTTNANGEILISNLEPGKSVVVTEVRAPDGFIIDTQPQTIVIKAGQTVSLTFQNQPKGELLIEKRDSVTNQVLPGAEFRVTTAAGCEVGLNGVIGDTTLTQNGIFTTDAEGHIRITGLMPGAYVITEIKAPNGYVIDNPMTNVVIGKKGDTQTVIIKNTPQGGLVIEKRDSVTKELLSGAVFKVTTSAGTVVDNAGGAVSSNGMYTTDASGRIVITNLDPDTYIITEVKAPDGYHMDAASQTVKMNKGDTQTLTFYDTPQNTLNIVKKDSATGEPLSGATFYVTDSTGAVADTAGGAVGSNGYYTTDKSGVITLTGLKTGTYIVRETTAPKGYILDNTPQTIAVTSGGTYTLTFYNKPEGSLIVEKRDKLTNEPLYGATFRVTTSSGEFVAQGGGTTSSNGLYTTDRNGKIQIYGLKPGTYVVTEETAPKGYLLDAPSQTVEVKANDTQTLTFYDTPIGGLIITKTDSQTGKRLEGAKYEVRKMNGEIIGTYYTDQNGNIQLAELESGWYEVVELKAPEGYLLDSTPQQVEVKDGQRTSLELTNTASASMLIHKIDSVTKKGIQGVKFVVYDSSMTPIGEYESDDQGYVHLNKTLKDGKYYVREIVAAPGYILDNQVKSFWVKSGDTSMIEWENTAEYGQIQIVKTSADYNTTNGLPAGTPLAGAVFTVYDKRNNVVDTIKTNASGIASTKLLPLGIYYVKETTAPTNYGLNTNTFTADLEFAGQVIKIQVSDPSITTGVTIKKTGYQQVMNNSPIRYTISGVANTSSVSLNSFYWRDTIPTDAMRLTRLVTGTYSATQNYKVTFTTNLNSNWRTAYDNLSTAKSYTLDMSAGALGLASNEYVTSFMLSFGIVPSGFHQLTNATVDGITLYALPNGYQFTNKADVGGLYGQFWQQSIARWTTSVYSNYVKPSPKLPRTGY